MEAVRSQNVLLTGIAEPDKQPSAPFAHVDYWSEPDPLYFAGLYERSEASKFELTFLEFSEILQDVSKTYLSAGTSPAQRAAFHYGLRLTELAMARACARGSASAWDYFLRQHRQKLYGAASLMAKDSFVARELVDSLCSELFGIRESEDGRRLSKFQSYTGRGSLDGWLRALIAQEYVNRYRNQRRAVSFEEHLSGNQGIPADESIDAAAVDARLEQAVNEALLGLPSEGRLILVSYYLDGHKLAEIARMFGVHESTISRKLDKITASLRKQIVRSLRKRGMSARAAEEALEIDVRDLSLDIRKCLLLETRFRGGGSAKNER
jgi:RNA polymerase sigma-70 factor, ECF subfamily